MNKLYSIFEVSNGVTTDSRNCPEGSIFFALQGDSFNGNAYAAQALEKGCSYAVIDDKNYFVPNDRYVLVDDVLKTLQQLANHHRKTLKTKIIGITGTNGKTTTKELIAAVLQKSFNVLYTLGNLNNHIGVPLTLLRLTPEHDIAVIEMGANHQGEIKELSEIAEPDYGIITNVGKAHLEGFGSFEGVIKTKSELYDYLRGKANSIVFVNKDNEYLMQMAKGLNSMFYGTEDDLDINGKITGNSPYLEFEWKVGKDGEKQHVNTLLIGDYNFTNALAAVAIGHYFNIDTSLINKALNEYQPQNNRSQLKKTAFNTLIIDAYNANPTSMKASVENFSKMDAPHKMVVLGDMKELGNDSLAEHRKILELVDKAGFERVVLIGEYFKAVNSKYEFYDHVNNFIAEVKKDTPKGMTILIKGSNSVRLSMVVEYL
ncbi:UDP-N-acetylmuramoyl-tripeptide--D-alanyl-D-alanine ligase [Bacteroides sp. 519]|uniref:UDP-N-acetylmuramoyl-tripeptide--D-alanyl-D- alanine ligase n=1 Tax=Bacteroides sp. 519 TaxID=2302937 RepID=UPI0013D1D500|nr:UDP-N-acetylmuramoyl-tripeptide--D-alanyl-D-alanine ligase [Bacteroides sp. 519]NDV57266.1 UDP-N-acetylmuramoyl-tripeptide--D-alanyl-D-alanine ligase [Bacteroides sp. 519]